MSNEVRIELKKEQIAFVKNNQIEESKANAIGYQVYACTDEVACWIGSCTDMASLEEIIGEEELLDTLNETASERELDIILPVLKYNNYKYNFFGDIRTAKKDCYESEEM